jgi:hypothetical protein
MRGAIPPPPFVFVAWHSVKHRDFMKKNIEPLRQINYFFLSGASMTSRAGLDAAMKRKKILPRPCRESNPGLVHNVVTILAPPEKLRLHTLKFRHKISNRTRDA